jgi:hypothetical protein
VRREVPARYEAVQHFPPTSAGSLCRQGDSVPGFSSGSLCLWVSLGGNTALVGFLQKELRPRIEPLGHSQ